MFMIFNLVSELHGKKRWALLINLALFVFALDATVAQTNNYSTRLFPTPDVLKPNVEFWKNIYAKYSEREVVIHDSEELNIVYEVVNLDSLFRGINISPRLQWKRIEHIKKEYKSILLRLSKRKNLRIETLVGKEKSVARLFGKKLNSKVLRRAAKRIRVQNGLKERFELGLRRSGSYLSKMREIFREAHLPLELLVLPHVESSFNYNAYSKFGAAGVWQFTRSTGRRYMKINYEVDERLDPIRATESAAKHLRRNYEAVGSWPLAITAYNHGLNGIKKAKRKYGNDLGKIVQHYRSRSFGFASRNFYAEFLAALHIANNYQYYFGEIEFYKPREFFTFQTRDYVTVRALTEAMNLDLDEFAEFNPALRTPVLRSRRRIPRNFKIRIPKRDNLNVELLYAKISPKFKYDEQVRPEWHKVRSGEYLSTIARKYKVGLGELMALNNIRNPHRIYAGQNLQIPTEGKATARKPTLIAKAEKPTQLAEATDLKKEASRTVLDVPPNLNVEYLEEESNLKLSPENRETPSMPARAPNDVEYLPAKAKSTSLTLAETSKQLKLIEAQKLVSQSEIIAEEMALALPNYYVELTKSMDVRIVKVPHVETVEAAFRELEFPQNGQVKVEPDETVGHFADWLAVSAQRVRTMNGLSFWEPIRIGQPLWLTFERVTPEEFHRRRIEYHQGIEEDFYRNFNIEGEQLYKVKRGDNIWLICNRNFEIPFWLVKKHNPGKDLLRLIAGDEIIIPIVEEIPQNL